MAQKMPAVEILKTKIFIPRLRREIVSRPRLINALNEGLRRKLTLISAPAGFGKTTLVADWVADCDRPTAWFSLDEEDNDPARFLNYLIAALNDIDGIEATFGISVMSMLQSPQFPPTDILLTPLINEMAVFPGELILILDDYHLIETQAVHDILCFLLDNMPPQLHLAIVTREDPFLPLSRLRVMDELTELRGVDLRFTSPEAAEFLHRVMGLNLSAEAVAALESRTEGWIAGLQLAALSLQGQTNTSRLIQAFTGSNRLVLDYLMEEVLDQQPEDIQAFLLQTAILDRLTGSLCDAVRFGTTETPTGQENGQEILERLDRANLFVFPQDNERRWYRYHHLFADLLRQRLRRDDPEKIRALHLLASEWFERTGLWSDAIRHAFAAGDLARVADLAELAWRPMNMSYRAVTWLGWVKALPEDLVRSRPTLSAGCGWASLDAGDLEAAELYLQDAERWLDAMANVNKRLEVPSDKTRSERSRRKVEPDEDKVRSLSTSLANARAYLAQALGDVAGTVKYARRATELLEEDDYFERGLSDILSGFAYWASGDLNAAYKAVADAVSNMQKTGMIIFVISFTTYLTDIMIAQGRLRETERAYLRLLAYAREQGGREVPETAVVHLGLSELYLEQGDLDAAIRHLEISEALGEQPAFAPWYRHWIFAHARVMEAQGDLDGVIEVLNAAERLFYRHPIPDVRPLKALIARARLAQGNLTEALRWVREQGLSVDGELSYLREFDHITLARVLIARYRLDRGEASIQSATRLLERLRQAAVDGGRMGSAIEILVLQALAHEARGDLQSALVSLERGLALAEPEGYIRIFVGEGPPMGHLLYEALARGISPEYIQHLLGAFPRANQGQALSPQRNAQELDWIEPLSEREMEVLELIAEGLTNQDIGDRLYLSLNTVKVHTRNIYGKLDVNSRMQAAARARDLGLLPLV
jgi:LuxR family maltose regulon positive regulatory protein